jgi:hypothetical protein
MIALLASVRKTQFNVANTYSPEAHVAYFDSVLRVSPNPMDNAMMMTEKARAYLQLGKEDSSRAILETLLASQLVQRLGNIHSIKKILALTYLRIGERTNCIFNHGAESCIFPIRDGGVHRDKTGSAKAAELYVSILNEDPGDLESRWLLNIAHMTLGDYPHGVPGTYLIGGLDTDSSSRIKPFSDAAINIGLNTRNMAGGSIVEDFNNDGYLDIITSGWNLKSPMRYCANNGDGSFKDLSASSGLLDFTGGSNIMQTDYNNEGLKDIFVLRGGWKGRFGNEPNSLLRNNGDGTFTDVTKEAGLLSFHPTQTATWNDFNNDGWLDVFIGNESSNSNDGNACEFFLNDGKGHFTNVAAQNGTGILNFVKAVTSGDYNNDGWPDIFISTMSNEKVLLQNEGLKNGRVHFKNVTKEAHLGNCDARTFGTWFWDYDNDGWLDLFLCNYDYTASLGVYAAAEALQLPTGRSAKQYLYHNNHDGTFTDVSDKCGLNKVAFAMGSNFGDIDNDGFPDIYLGTGNPDYESIVPNKAFRNVNGQYFTDITAASRLGNLQKGHGVSFADIDNDGDEDIYVVVGGAYEGDAYENSLYINPGQNENNWINISLEGVTCNRAAIGARIRVTFREHGVERSVYREVNSGGSFGSSPLRQHIGIGQATNIESLEIKWPGSNTLTVFKNIRPCNNLHVKEGAAKYDTLKLAKCDFLSRQANLISCGVPAAFTKLK